MSDSIVFDQDRIGGRVPAANDLGREVKQDLRDAYALAFDVDPALAGAVFSELREVRREREAVAYEIVSDPVKMEYRLELTTMEIEYQMTEASADGWHFVTQLRQGILLEREVKA